MNGKEKCEFLKGIRKRMAEANGIPYEPRECTYEGDCIGTCPFCEKEAKDLLVQLKKKEAEGDEIKTDPVIINIMEKVNRDTLPLDSFRGPHDSIMSEKEHHEMYIRQVNRPLMGDIRLRPNEKRMKEREELIHLLKDEIKKAEKTKTKSWIYGFLMNIRKIVTRGIIEEEE